MVFKSSLKLSKVYGQVSFFFILQNDYYKELNNNRAHQLTLSHLTVTLALCFRDFVHVIDWRLRLKYLVARSLCFLPKMPPLPTLKLPFGYLSSDYISL